jgi:hypothetical protein
MIGPRSCGHHQRYASRRAIVMNVGITLEGIRGQQHTYTTWLLDQGVASGRVHRFRPRSATTILLALC